MRHKCYKCKEELTNVDEDEVRYVSVKVKCKCGKCGTEQIFIRRYTFDSETQFDEFMRER